MKEYQDLLPRAISLAAQVFEGKNDKGGAPYILHCIRVMQNPRVAELGHSAQIVAVLHDVVEDSDVTIDDIIDEFDSCIATFVAILTHRRSEDYLEEYVRNIAQWPNPVPKAVKLADLEDNMNILRQPTLRDKDLLRLQKYHIAYRMLTS